MLKKNRNWNMKGYLIGLSISLLAVFAPVKELLTVAIVLILVDLITGILAARKRGEKIKSAGLRRTFTKFCVYMTGICIGWLIESVMLEGFIAVSKIAAGLISVIEGKSIFENLDKINGSSVFKSLIQKLGSVNDTEKEPEEKKEDGESL